MAHLSPAHNKEIRRYNLVARTPLISPTVTEGTRLIDERIVFAPPRFVDAPLPVLGNL